VPTYTVAERNLVTSIVASLSIKRIPDPDIIKEVYDRTTKTLSRSGLWRIRQSIKRESYHWYKTMREGEYEYIHEFKERINEIMQLQKKHHQIIDANEHNPQIQQTSLTELHRLNITLSNYFDVAPSIINGIGNDITISAASPQQTKTTRTSSEPETETKTEREFIV
jgi:hypothetical protein